MVNATDHKVGPFASEYYVDSVFYAAGRGSVKVPPVGAVHFSDMLCRNRLHANGNGQRHSALRMFRRDYRDVAETGEHFYKAMYACGLVAVIICYKYLHSPHFYSQI